MSVAGRECRLRRWILVRRRNRLHRAPMRHSKFGPTHGILTKHGMLAGITFTLVAL